MEYLYTKNTNAPKLIKEIKSLNLSGFTGLYTIGQTVHVVFDEALSSADKEILDLKVDSHTNDIDQQAYVENKIAKAKEFGSNLVTEFGARNVLSGLTTAQIAQVMEKLGNLIVALNTGSLNVALATIDTIEPDEILTQSLIDSYKTKISDFLATI